MSHFYHETASPKKLLYSRPISRKVMDEAVLLVRQGDISEFYDLLNANFGGDVGGYMEAACRILHDVVGDPEVVMVVDDRLESIVELTRPRLCPKQFAERYPFTRTDPMQKYLEALRMHWHFKSQDEPSLFYSASCTYQALVERYLDGGDFAYKKTGQVLDLDFGVNILIVVIIPQKVLC